MFKRQSKFHGNKQVRGLPVVVFNNCAINYKQNRNKCCIQGLLEVSNFPMSAAVFTSVLSY